MKTGKRQIPSVLRKIFLVSAVLFCFAAIYGVYYLYDNYLSTHACIEKITGIDLPPWTWTEEEYDNGEFAVVAKYSLTESGRETFITENNLTLYSQNPVGLTCADWLQPENQPDYAKPTLYSLSNCTDHNSWTILLDRSTGELWIEVHYPDFSGDSPGCDSSSFTLTPLPSP